MFSPSPLQFAIVLVIVLLFFGKRIPETMKSLGLGVKEFKKGLDGVDDKKEDKQAVESEQKEKTDA